MMWWSCLLLPASSVVAIQLGQECIPNEHVQNQYCRSDFAIKLSVKRLEFSTKVGENDYDAYEVVLRTQFRVSPDFVELNDSALHRLFVPADVPGLKLKPYAKYIVTGHIARIGAHEVALVADRCGWTQLWEKVSHRTRGFLRKQKFELNCGCKVSTTATEHKSCLRSHPFDLAAHRKHIASGVELPRDFWSESVPACYDRHSFCGHKHNRCAWSTNDVLVKCIYAAYVKTIN